MHVKKGDNVIILSGDDKGKTGKVLSAFPGEGKVLVEGVNVMKKHERPRTQGKPGTIVDRAMPVHVSKVALAGAEKKAPAAKKAAPKKEAKAEAAKK